MDIFQPLDNDEGQLLQAYVNRGYELFTKRVADGRKKKQDYIKTIGEGRVWTGVHAKEIGLVDQLGSLDDAIKVAKQKAKVENYSVLKYPEVPDFFTTLFNDIVNNDNYADKKMKENFGELYDFAVSTKRLLEKDRLQAAMPYYIRFNL
jgi:protease-4